MRKLFTFCVVLFATTALWAYDFQSGDLYYNITSNTEPYTVEVTYEKEWSSDNYKGLTSVTIPETVTYDGTTYAVTSIGYGAFYDCTGLTSVTIPNSVTSIEASAFDGRTGLTSIQVQSQIPPQCHNSFSSVPQDISIYVPCGTKEAYQTSASWSSFTNIKDEYSVTLLSSNDKYGTATIVSRTCNELTIQATANEHYHFVQWSDGNTDNPRSVSVEGETAFTAEFAPNRYTISVECHSPWNSSWGCDCGMRTFGAGEYDYGEVIVLYAYDYYDNHYHFSGWWSSDYSFYSNYEYIEVLVEGDATYIATFLPNSYDFHVSVWNGRAEGTGLYVYGETVTITIYADEHYHFEQWSDGCTDNPRTLYVEGEYGPDAECVPDQHTISASAKNGHIEGTGLHNYGTTATLTAVGDEHYHFVQWSDGNTDNPRSVSVEGDASYTAEFAVDQHTISVSAENGRAEGIGAYNYGTTATLTAIANEHYQFVQWGDGNTDNPRTIEVSGDTTLVVQFAPITSGQCGDDLYWSYADNILTISGMGSMYDYSENDVPWLLFRSMVTDVVWPYGITHIGNYAFDGFVGLYRVELPNTLTTIGDYAFRGCKNIETISFGTGLSSIGDYALDGCQSIYEMTCYATKVPTVGSNTFREVSTRADLYVPSGSVKKYKTHAYWGVFNILSIEAETVSSSNTVTTQPGENDVVMTWPANENADTYAIQITKGGVVFCTLVFNANGQLTNIAFSAPAYYGERNYYPAAAPTQSGYRFTITGLSSATYYAYDLVVRDSEESVLETYSGTFTTKGGTPTSVQNATIANLYTENGRIICDSEFQIFDLLGRDVTKLNGQLNGVYIVKVGDKAQKVVVK